MVCAADVPCQRHRTICHNLSGPHSIYQVTYLPVDRDGVLKLADLENAITDDTAVVSLIWANNETGVLFSMKEVAEIRSYAVGRGW